MEAEQELICKLFSTWVKKNVAENNNIQKPLWCLGIHLMYHQKIHIFLKFVVLTGCFLSNAK